MSRFFGNKAVRLLLALAVSVWMAGGCVLGCSNGVMAADLASDSVQTVEAGESCHTVQSHHCCSAPEPKKKAARNLRQPIGLPSFLPAPRDLMTDCPLAVNATAATSKNTTQGSDPGPVPAADLPSVERQTISSNNVTVVSFLPNRGPTHLRCCVFLI